ncbi:hypothetical protein KCP76_19295 [Salmonella enterica subsp. enterica serovar Weltevreden]|nr:hypothetical protein KCP76_19295 [Salmonella enterica subsp. enterica serovar Weltevreden]
MRPLKSLTNVNAQFQRGMAACRALFAILDSEQEKDEGKRVIDRATGDLGIPACDVAARAVEIAGIA